MKIKLRLFFVLAFAGSVSVVSAQTPVKVVHAYYNDVYRQFNAQVVKVLGLEKEQDSSQHFSYIRAANHHRLSIDYQLYEDSRIISVQISGKKKDLVDLFAAFYDRKVKTNKLSKRSMIKNDEWVRLLGDEGKIIIQAIIY
jgi:hypothetical protein